MVSFSCEACGDILTKKKLDPHRSQCRGASYTCVDCMVHFNGTEYRSHTSCMTEAQKYQGALYKEKPSKNQRKGNSNDFKQVAKSNAANSKTTTHYLQQPFVEEVLDASSFQYNAPPPPAPTPPITTTMTAPTAGANSAQPVNVFDYLVTEDTPGKPPNSSKKPMQMVDHAPSLFEHNKGLTRAGTEGEYETNGFSYGAGPIEPSTNQNMPSNASMGFATPIPKKKRDRSGAEGDGSRDNRKAGNTSEKKRKRGNAEDSTMTDVPPPSTVKSTTKTTPALNHSGLTGGLDRMLRIPSLDGRNDNNGGDHQDNSSPVKRTRRSDKETNSDPRRSRAERLVSSMLGSSGANDEITAKALVRTRRNHSDSSETQKPKKMHRQSSQSSAQHPSSSTATTDSRKTKRKMDDKEDRSSSGRLRRIEYRRNSHDRSRSRSPRHNSRYYDRQMAVHRHSTHDDDKLQHQMANDFLSLVTKGPESGRGMSVHKTLKRLHGNSDGRDYSDLDREQQFEDDREMWRALRLKRNERGEVVLFI